MQLTFTQNLPNIFLNFACLYSILAEDLTRFQVGTSNMTIGLSLVVLLAFASLTLFLHTAGRAVDQLRQSRQQLDLRRLVLSGVLRPAV